MLLAQPVARRALCVKLGLPRDRPRGPRLGPAGPSAVDTRLTVYAPTNYLRATCSCRSLTGLFLAPALTLLTRQPAGRRRLQPRRPGNAPDRRRIVGVRLYGYTTAVDQFRLAFSGLASSLACAAAALATWRGFARLQPPGEVSDEAPPFHPGAPRSAARFSARSVWILLIVKELRLQSRRSRSWRSTSRSGGLTASGFDCTGASVFQAISAFYGSLTAMLIGALAERGRAAAGHDGMGAHPAPGAGRKVWAIKDRRRPRARVLRTWSAAAAVHAACRRDLTSGEFLPGRDAHGEEPRE